MSVRLDRISKSFGGVHALKNVSLALQPGEVLALVGENGAGKSTLMKILSGIHPEYDGQIFVNGSLVKFESPSDAERAGISIIHQELATFPDLTVAENLAIGHWPKSMGAVDWKEIHTWAIVWLSKVGAVVDPDAIMGTLSVGTQQLVEIAKALSRGTKVLVFDEPTSALTPPEIQKLFLLIEDLKSKGHGIIYISHKLDEVFKLSDRIQVLRDGESVLESETKSLTEESLLQAMAGRKVKSAVSRTATSQDSRTVFEVKNFAFEFQDRRYGPFDFTLKRGEILGLSGLLGAGRSELLGALMGLSGTTHVSGQVLLEGSPLHVSSPRDAWSAGISFVPEDRKQQSILPRRGLHENQSVSALSVSGDFFIRYATESTRASQSLKSFGTRFASLDQDIESLSGGNQQKVILARALETKPKVLLLDEPTRGIDVGAKNEIYEILVKLASEGVSLIVASSELPELTGLCDRILVLSEGEPSGCLKKHEFSETQILRLAIGKKHWVTPSP